MAFQTSTKSVDGRNRLRTMLAEMVGSVRAEQGSKGCGSKGLTSHLWFDCFLFLFLTGLQRKECKTCVLQSKAHTRASRNLNKHCICCGKGLQIFSLLFFARNVVVKQSKWSPRKTCKETKPCTSVNEASKPSMTFMLLN
ncbi:hypothetical protein L1987_32515 [Smallanthus sonchifolius]|uniref:Uncharacterized protein n=1 Tax=Smallanthus sonchifolius TaxID=185202 RepID=A0ACB9HPS6_9ASTR|nr:hypothetical protein L1987_32515 [Smallanthus sonchifolius]